MSDDSSDIRATLEWLHLIRPFYVFCNLDALEFGFLGQHLDASFIERLAEGRRERYGIDESRTTELIRHDHKVARGFRRVWD
eukprot:1569302-Amphidinium_carterae.1